MTQYGNDSKPEFEQLFKFCCDELDEVCDSYNISPYDSVRDKIFDDLKDTFRTGLSETLARVRSRAREIQGEYLYLLEEACLAPEVDVDR